MIKNMIDIIRGSVKGARGEMKAIDNVAKKYPRLPSGRRASVADVLEIERVQKRRAEIRSAAVELYNRQTKKKHAPGCQCKPCVALRTKLLGNLYLLVQIAECDHDAEICAACFNEVEIV